MFRGVMVPRASFRRDRRVLTASAPTCAGLKAHDQTRVKYTQQCKERKAMQAKTHEWNCLCKFGYQSG